MAEGDVGESKLAVICLQVEMQKNFLEKLRFTVDEEYVDFRSEKY